MEFIKLFSSTEDLRVPVQSLYRMTSYVGRVNEVEI